MVWENTLNRVPEKDGMYDCTVEFDGYHGHAVVRKTLQWFRGRWVGLVEDEVVTYWRIPIKGPTVPRCKVCGWPISFCRCNSARAQFL